jgi:hypothetical protein
MPIVIPQLVHPLQWYLKGKYTLSRNVPFSEIIHSGKDIRIKGISLCVGRSVSPGLIELGNKQI